MGESKTEIYLIGLKNDELKENMKKNNIKMGKATK
jgi:hypothetical protein